MEEQYKDIDKLVREAGLDTPSPDFLQQVMKQVEASQSNRAFVYKPLISKSAWLVVSLIAIGVIFALVSLPDVAGTTSKGIDISFLNSINIKNPLSGMVLTKATIYGVLFLGLLFFVQVTLLKKRIDRSFSM
ncbi:hypothetical protein [Aquimarina mytili]|uniref:Uncharacterized protein n=1 Tax=Aquimarina mytili TaxID=874423 RepID=A0A937A4U2_9FLAO|nr:hypothetical protein [Aquimarina mytili]MBL0684935.1 hypothetical protein [Aquimarina mytili]